MTFNVKNKTEAGKYQNIFRRTLFRKTDYPLIQQKAIFKHISTVKSKYSRQTNECAKRWQ